MFKNVVSTQELLSDSQRSNYSSDSALFSLSQKQQSQNEFSQIRTQDLFTQGQGGSQSESSFPPTRKMSMYDKWMSKGTLFKKDQPAQGRFGPVQFKPQQAQNKGSDPDDRELLQQVVNIVQDCNKEVKSTLTAVTDKLASQTELTGEKLCDTMKAFLEDIWKHEERMLQAITERKQSKELEKKLGELTSESSTKINELEKQLAVKEAELKQLQSQMKDRGGKPENLKQMAIAVRQELLSPQLAVENKLMEILEVTRGASEQQSEQMNVYKNQMTARNKQYSELKSSNQKLIKDMEKRLQKDIGEVKKSLQKQDQEWQSTICSQLSQTTAVYFHDLENLIQKILCEALSGKTFASDSSGVATSIKKDMLAALQRQSKSMEKSLQDILTRQLRVQQQQINQLHKTLLDDITTGMEQVQEGSKENAVERLTAPVLDEKFEEYHADLKHQLEEMHRNHLEEVRKLQQKLNIHDKSSVPGLPGKFLPTSHIPEEEAISAAESASRILHKTSFPRSLSGKEKISSTRMAGKELVPVGKSTRASSAAAWGGRPEYVPKPRDGPKQAKSVFSPLTQQERASLFSKARAYTSTAVQNQKYFPPKDASQTNLSSDSDREIIFSQLQTQLRKNIPADMQVVPFKSSSQESNEVVLLNHAAGQGHSEDSYADSPRSQTDSPPRKALQATAKKSKDAKKRKRGKNRNKKRKSAAQEPKMQTATTTQSSVKQRVTHQKALANERGIPNKAERNKVYDFSQEQSPDKCWWQLDSFHLQRNRQQQPALCSPDIRNAGMFSEKSSPAISLKSPGISVTVDNELVVVRRSRWQTSTTVTAPQETNVWASQIQMPNSSLMTETERGDPRRSKRKRTL